MVGSTTACSPHRSRTQAVAAPSKPSSRPDKTPLAVFPLEARWTLALNLQLAPGTAPAYEGTRAFFPLEDERIVAYDLAHGSQLWIAPANAALSPIAGNDLLFVPGANRLIALHLADGSVAWEVPLADALAVPPTFDNGWLVLATIRGDAIALRAADGGTVWHQPLGSPAHAPPALAADRVYVGTEDGRIVALNVETGERVWEHRLGGAASDILALDDRLFAGSKDNYFYSLRTDDGSVDWLWRTGADIVGRPVLDARTVYFVSLDNVLWALHRGSGNQRWKRALSLRPTTGPLKAGPVLLVTGYAAKLPAFKIEDGTPAGDVPVVGEVAAPLHAVELPSTFGPTIFVVSRDVVKGATVTALAHSFEPQIVPVTPLPNLTRAVPNTPTP